MHKRSKRIIQYSAATLLAIVLSLTITLGYLYFSADMLVPKTEPDTLHYQLVENGCYRQYGDNFLRKSESGLWELKVCGGPFQRGVAIGKLSTDLLYYQEKVFVDQIKELIPSPGYLKFLRFFITIFNRNLAENVLEEFRKEIYGISLSCTDEYNDFGTPYQRQLNYHAAHDIGHAMQDYMLVGCSSFASWGSRSADSSLIIGRNFDFYMGDGFARNKEVAFYAPDSGYKFASVGWPGMTGVLSGMNEAGLTVTINAAKSAVPMASATPISLLTREILQYASTIDQAYAIAQKRKTFVAESILIGSAKDGRAAIIEKSPDKISLFYGSGEQIICTNHFQSETFSQDRRNIENIRTSDSPYRYARLEELLGERSPVDERVAAGILRDRMGLQGKEVGLANEMVLNQFIAHHSVIFKPEQRIMWVSTSPWQSGKYVAYDLNKVFGSLVDFSQEIYSKELTIPADTFLYSPDFERLMRYRELTALVKKNTALSQKMDAQVLSQYKESNPEMYYTYEVLGDYYHATANDTLARQNWEQALTKTVPKQSERERIQKKLENVLRVL